MNAQLFQCQGLDAPPSKVTELNLELTVSYANGKNNSDGYAYKFNSEDFDFANSIKIPCFLNCLVRGAANVTETFFFAGYTWTNQANVSIEPPSAVVTAEKSNSMTLIIDFKIENDATNITFAVQPSIGKVFYADPQEDNDPQLTHP